MTRETFARIFSLSVLCVLLCSWLKFWISLGSYMCSIHNSLKPQSQGLPSHFYVSWFADLESSVASALLPAVPSTAPCYYCQLVCSVCPPEGPSDSCNLSQQLGLISIILYFIGIFKLLLKLSSVGTDLQSCVTHVAWIVIKSVPNPRLAFKELEVYFLIFIPNSLLH